MSILRIICPILLVVFLAACNGSSGAAEQSDYDTTKKMMVDILKTDEGQKALMEVLSDEKMKQELALESEEVSSAVKETLLSEEGKEFWSKLFSDPSFVQEFSKVVQEEQEDLMKGLMKDSEYQASLIQLYQNPEMMEKMLEVMQGQQFRGHLEKTIEETLNNPVFQAKMSETLLKAAEEMQSGGGGSQDEGGDQQNQEQSSDEDSQEDKGSS
ncbi:germination protein GerD [Halobacillus andaensis]|uniref:Germination protein GerD n=1 Tax=Halobacillus andaensis TaxID=1176239 RepID=A0A917BDQ9_HALAA|nr:spore germination lipoprotein GerD [Halobacillus andaensis]MBP2006645.1 spore germination protein D [Halobacillus andaensis]GGF34921.1 germination protein GerD [Halobacillus andaensis]